MGRTWVRMPAGLTAPVQPGLTYPVTFTFAEAGSVTLDVPVENPGLVDN